MADPAHDLTDEADRLAKLAAEAGDERLADAAEALRELSDDDDHDRDLI